MGIFRGSTPVCEAHYCQSDLHFTTQSHYEDDPCKLTKTNSQCGVLCRIPGWMTPAGNDVSKLFSCPPSTPGDFGNLASNVGPVCAPQICALTNFRNTKISAADTSARYYTLQCAGKTTLSFGELATTGFPGAKNTVGQPAAIPAATEHDAKCVIPCASGYSVGREVDDTEKTLRIHTFFQTVFLLALVLVVGFFPYVSSRPWDILVGGDLSTK